MTPRAGAPRLVRPLLVAFLAVAAVDLAGLLAGLQTAHLLAKPLLMPLLAATAAARGGPRLLVAALLFGWGGDVLLMPGSDAAFLAGMACFAAGHVCYLVLFGRAELRPAAGLLYAAALVAFLVHLWPGLPAELKVPLTGYSLLLAAMAWRVRRPRAVRRRRRRALPALRRAHRHRHRRPAAAPRPRFLDHADLSRRAVPAHPGALGGTADSTGAAPGAYREGSIRI